MRFAASPGMDNTSTIPKASVSPRNSSFRRKATAREVMTVDPETVSADASLFTAASIMAELGVRHLPVVDAEGRLVGIISDRDVRTALGDPLELLRGRDDSELTVGSVMSTEPLSETLTTPIGDLAGLLADERIGAIPIVDDDSHPIGIVSYVDVLSWYAKSR